jgi:hypothetical protein
MPRRFQTVPPDLLPHAEAAAADFAMRGYRVRRERTEPGYPFTPTLECFQRPTTLVVEIDDAVRRGRLEEWVAFGRSCGRDFRCSVCVPTHRRPVDDDEQWLREKGLGLYLSDAGALTERIAGRDLAMNVSLPSKQTLSSAALQAVGRIYQKVDRTELEEAFDEACKVLEREARRHLIKGIRSSRVSLVDAKGRDRTPKPKAVSKYTIGKLAKAFSQIQSQTTIDSKLQAVLEQVNRDRGGSIHHRERTQGRLRRDAGRHLWAIVGAVRILKP